MTDQEKIDLLIEKLKELRTKVGFNLKREIDLTINKVREGEK